jgi:hypothetical protein
MLCVCSATRAAAAKPAVGPADGHVLIDVPFLPQTPELCGGAALAMVMRYWGDRSVLPADFQSLVKPSARGIETTDLSAAVTARGWQAFAGEGESATRADLQRQVDQGRPVIVLIEPTPGRFHYVVVVGVTPSSVVFHDPARTSFHVAAADEFDHEWRGSLNWRLVVLPPPTSESLRSRLGESASPELSAPAVPQARTGACGALVDRGVGLADTDSASAERVLTAASELCPSSADPWLERAGLRFRASAWREAAEFAERAAERDPHNDDAWALVATARYLGDDESGALDAWNRIGEPTIDTVNISGARQTPQPALHRLLGLEPRTLLTRSAFERGARRLDDAPTASVTSLHFDPAANGLAVVQGAIVERSPYPRSLMSLVVLGGRAIFADEIRGDFAGLAGQGESMTALWRYPVARPRVEGSISIPSPAPLPGIATIDVFWEAQSYAVPLSGSAVAIERDERRRVSFDLDTWVSGNTRLEGGAALDRFDNDDHLATSAALEQHLLRDLIVARAQAEVWTLGRGQAFWTHDVSFAWRTKADRSRPFLLAIVGDSATSANAPRALWMGAGTGQGRPMLLRAHPLVRTDIIRGPMFGRHFTFSTVEYQHPLRQMITGGIAAAAFVDAAQAWNGLGGLDASPFQVDAGVGLRVRLPSDAGSLRLDVAHALRDGNFAFSVGWSSSDSTVVNRRVRR